ncbi:hypothetical protein ABZ897_38565 [Nonomuraea sp. NPDC046802]|uniref:hypothetical protein n=1 Tax=Nonomuraea sp. NPDC046802 TaxID=3154919 RepID=UPI003405B14B
MKRILLSLAALMMAVGGLAATATSANAATGTLLLYTTEGTVVSYTNPASGCRSTSFTFTKVSNRTDTSVFVHQLPGCKGPFHVVTPGRTPVPVDAGQSVRIPA